MSRRFTSDDPAAEGRLSPQLQGRGRAGSAWQRPGGRVGPSGGQGASSGRGGPVFPLRLFFLPMNKNGSAHVFQCPSLLFCSLGREQEWRELTVVEMGGGGCCVQSHPLCHQLLGSTSARHGQLPPSGESPQCQAGRLTQQNGWHMPVV